VTSTYDGRAFIRSSALQLMNSDVSVKIMPKHSRRPNSTSAPDKPPERLQVLKRPKTFNHYVMNLPATATTFLDAFIGIYRGHERLFAPHTDTELPMIHVHCFSTKSADSKEERVKICTEVSERLGHTVSPDDPKVEVFDVRDVAPQKRMFCASFRLPPEVAFR